MARRKKKIEKTIIYIGKITGFRGSWGSGMADLVINGKGVPCDNGTTVRSLEACFGNVIGAGHTVKSDGGFMGKRIAFSLDDMGLMMERFTPEQDFRDRVKEVGREDEVEYKEW
jgi:hypothetical protein